MRGTHALRALVALTLLALIVRQLGGLGPLGAALARLEPAWIAVAFAVGTLDRVLMTYKWCRLLRVRGQALGVVRGTQIYCTSMVWGMFLPATMGADAVRTVSAVRSGLEAEDVLASILVERAVGFLASLVIGLLGLLAISQLGAPPPGLAPVWWTATALLLVGAAVLAASLSERVNAFLEARVLGGLPTRGLVERLRRLHESYRAYRRQPGELTLFFGLSLLEQLLPAVAVWGLARGLGVELSPLYTAGAVALSFLVARVPVSLGGLGVLEGALVALLSFAGVDGPTALAIALAARVVEIASWLPWWLAHTWRTPREPAPGVAS